MKLTVVFARHPRGTPQGGYLAAYVVSANQKRGRNLLAGCHITGVPYAKVVVQRELGRLVPGSKIFFKEPTEEMESA